MPNFEGLTELTNQDLEQVNGGACQLVAVIFIDEDGDGSTDGIIAIYGCN